MKFKEKIKYVIISPYLITYKGHDFNYINSLINIFAKKKANINVLVPKNNINFKSNFFKKLLPLPGKRLLSKIKYLIFFYLNVNKYIKKQRKINKEKTIYILESFHFIHFFIIFIILFFQNNTFIALVLRYKNIFNTKSLFINYLNSKIYNFFLKKKIILFTDSYRIKNYNKSLNIHMIVLPIPHIKFSDRRNNNFANKKNYSLWLPGPPREDKNISRILELLKNSTKLPLTLYISDEVKERFSNIKSIEIKFVKSDLKEDEYYHFFSKIDFVFLPYKQNAYEYSTSGIFVESIALSIPCFVTNHTWMSHEYNYYGINNYSLTIKDGIFEDILRRIKNLKKNNTQNFYKMRNSYQKFHTPDNFYKIFTQETTKFIL